MQANTINICDLLSSDIISKLTTVLPPLYSTEDVSLRNKLVICEFHFSTTNQDNQEWIWYVFEGKRLADYPRESDGCLIKNDYRFFGMVHGFENEQGYFLLSELLELRDSQTGKFLIQLDPTVYMKPYSQFFKKITEEIEGTEEADEKTDKKCLTFREWMLNQFDHNELSDICTHGANAGWSGLIYYSDTSDLYEKYSEDIWGMLYEDYQSQGSASCLELIISFQGAKDVNSDDQFKNLLVWYAAERIAFEITECDEADTE